MTLSEMLVHFTWPDVAALTFLFAAWLGSGWLIENPVGRRKSTSILMRQYREDWMREFVTRQPRIFDSAILDTLRQGTLFFASSTMIAIGGGLALVGNPEPLRDVASDLVQDQAPEVIWEIKIFLVLLLLTSAFLNFVWSHRVFGYCAVIMASVPNDPDEPNTYARAAKAAEVNMLAARSFNRGMRTIYFSLGAVGWLAGATVLAIGTLVVLLVVWRREFASHSRDVLRRDDL
ncbi:DUF599 domain-containing protein [Tropicimonas isoalkanivorans]|uniref:Uncharacterized membrane protein n=1 Tax=Tropicimonas isoalkanivorans TaxID=441112 RepID=A0A1I1PR96_9RHOB|nr:DUF599 domain-containing protein [Tropicimonas isoalkanivorans]SFD12391.1 Uncharacterized membrane protein [Tropicimonas isoalkanivorans]